MLCFVPMLHGCVWYDCCYVRNNAFFSVVAITERALVYVLVAFMMGDYVSQLPYVWYYVGVNSSFQHARDECECKRAYVF